MVAELADQADDVVDAYMTLLVHAGIAAADLICCARLGEHALGTDHGEAVALLKQAAGAKTSGHLSTLLAVKTKAGYTIRMRRATTERRQSGRPPRSSRLRARSEFGGR